MLKSKSKELEFWELQLSKLQNKQKLDIDIDKAIDSKKYILKMIERIKDYDLHSRGNN